jgi:hypothetical protein
VSMKKLVIAAVALAGAGTLAGATPAFAAPSEITPLWCGATAATVYNGAQIVVSRSCSGESDYAKSWSTKLVANGWSGAVYDMNGGAHYFCDWQTITLNTYTHELYLNNTKPARCK